MYGGIIGIFNCDRTISISPFHVISPKSVYKRIKIWEYLFLFSCKCSNLLIAFKEC